MEGVLPDLRNRLRDYRHQSDDARRPLCAGTDSRLGSDAADRACFPDWLCVVQNAVPVADQLKHNSGDVSYRRAGERDTFIILSVGGLRPVDLDRCDSVHGSRHFSGNAEIG
ncbi:hypothetical protein D3C71_1715940 [compost metagenome]